MNKQTEALKMAIELIDAMEYHEDLIGYDAYRLDTDLNLDLDKIRQACKEALELSEKQHTISDKDQPAQGIDPYVLAGVALEVASFLADDNMDITRAEWRNIVITQALRCIRECNITQETDDIDEVYVSWLAQEESYS